MAKTKVVALITGQVILRGRSIDSESDNVGLSFHSADEQNICMEVLAPSIAADELKVDRIYNVTLSKGAETSKPSFEVSNLVTVDGAGYSERMVIKPVGDKGLRGHLSLSLKEDQRDFFYEEDQFSITLEEIEQEA